MKKLLFYNEITVIDIIDVNQLVLSLWAE